MKKTAPLTDAIIIAVSKLIDDAQADVKREPSHYDLDMLLKKVGLAHADPRTQGQQVGKSKRIRIALNWAIEKDFNSGERLVGFLISNIRGYGGFRSESKNYCGKEPIDNLIDVFKNEGYLLTLDGELKPILLDNINEKDMTEALFAYAQRARKGAEDAALLLGTGKDLLEAVSKHVLTVKSINYQTNSFPFILAQAFIALGMVTSQHTAQPNEAITAKYERALYDLGCAINNMRNKEGTGHGRPFMPTITQAEAYSAIQSIGIISDYMIRKLKQEV
ncbi:abortive infection family protein [Paenibacillus sp. IHBB 10380]|uniref:abortive infection family protein n=1 Tax=Paenibacillus sp. IHBB 10380 TaxID=1566358 RepID=UPI0005CFB81D|nr:abortive infection family protein [Paenibacillus sp. IHBB 10380]AJS58272.1 hypothetical protein UB51_06925 [Paenibacillus sp. IHBB 10380]